MIYRIFLIFVLSASFAQSQEVPPPPPPLALPAGSSKTINGDEIFDFPDIEAEFPTGISGLQNYISQNVVYPMEAIKNKEEGKVYIVFVVHSSGKIQEAKVVKGISEYLDAEALRLIQNMPDWIPAQLNGKNVSSRCQIPIIFNL